jgi:hypothetical protein
VPNTLAYCGTEFNRILSDRPLGENFKCKKKEMKRLEKSFYPAATNSIENTNWSCSNF